MPQYILAGLALGSIYAIASAGLVVTSVSAGVFNLVFGSMAYVVARFYYWLNSLLQGVLRRQCRRLASRMFSRRTPDTGRLTWDDESWLRETTAPVAPAGLTPDPFTALTKVER
jgi:hypothetical protein